MDDLISRKALINKIDAIVIETQDVRFIKEMIKEQPPVEAVEVVHCKELALKYTGHLSDDVVCGMISRQNEIIQFIKAQPTFDIEAIVKELEELRKITDVPMIHSYCNATISKAIEIVRKGGVNHA